MRRREFIALVSGVAATATFAARAQQAEAVKKIGVLWPGATYPAPPRMPAFTQALRQLGFVEGQNLAIELRYARDGEQQLPELADELARANVDVIAAFGDLAPRIAHQKAEKIPIVAVSCNEVSRFSVATRWDHHRIDDHVPRAQRQATRGAPRDDSKDVASGCAVGSDYRSVAGHGHGKCCKGVGSGSSSSGGSEPRRFGGCVAESADQ